MPLRESPPSTRPNIAALATIAIASGIAVLVAYFVWVRTYNGQRVDQAAFDGRVVPYHARVAAGHLLSTISVGSLVAATCVLAALALIRNRRTLALVAFIAIAGAVLTTEILKFVIFHRPPLTGYESPYGNSFPSGHTTVAFSVSIAAVIVAPPRLRRLVAVAAFAYGTGIGLSTVFAGWHRPSDVVGGLLVATGWAAGTVALFAALDRDAFGPSSSIAEVPTRHSLFAPHRILVVAFVGWVGAIAIAAASQASSLDLTHANAAFLLACLAITALAAAVFATLLQALRPALPAR